MTPNTETDRSVLLLSILRDFAQESRLSIPRGEITLDSRLETDLGLDSLARSELLSRLEEGLDIDLPEEALLATTPRDLLTLLEAERGEVAAVGTGTPRLSEATGVGCPEDALTLIDALDWHCERHPERVHILYYGANERPAPIRYGELADGATRVAARLLREGLKRGETVAVMLPTSPEYFFSFLGILAAGGVPVPIYPPARPQQIEDHLRRHARILSNAGTTFLITIPAARMVSRLLRTQVATLHKVLTLDALGDEPPVPMPPAPGAHDIAFLQYTSGSTGDPKGVILTHADLLANIRAMGQATDVRPEDIFVSWLPLYHDMGLIGAWLGSLYFGIPLVSMSPLAFLAKPLRWLQAIHDHRGTISAAPNFAYELCLTRIADADLDGLDLSSWRWAFNGAEPVSPITLRRFAERFARCGLRREALAPVYGLAEAAVGLAFPPLGRGPRIDCIDRTRFAHSGHALPIPCSDANRMEVPACGRPLPGYRVRVVDQGGRELPERHEGVLQFQGPSATRGYFRNPQATGGLIRDGWHDTGDRAYLADGDIHLTGRVKDLIIRGGRNIYPYELEQAVGEIPGIRKGCVAAFAAADEQSGSERLVLVAETRERDPTRRAALEKRVRERASDVLGLPPDQVILAPPRAVLKTSSGKLRRGATRDLYLAGRLLVGPPHPLWQLVRVGGAGVAARFSRLVKRTPGYLYAGYAWTLLALIAPWVWLGVVTAPRPAWRWALVRGGIRVLRRLAFIRLDVTGREKVPQPGRSFILTANHQSYLDALMLIEAIPRPLGFVAKRELAANPLVGRLLSRLGALFVERFDPRISSAETKHFSSALGRGETLAFFPEGTFRDEPGLLGFRMGAFAAAAEAGVQVLPVVVRGTRRLMHGERFILRPGRATVLIADPLEPAGEDWQAAVRLRDTTRAFILRHCGEPDRSG
ncbi:MAG: AMP-binding protein [Pseudomonadota bacterium]|nr:AMP-binding protein [Pseudomonadota bacterium]